MNTSRPRTLTRPSRVARIFFIIFLVFIAWFFRSEIKMASRIIGEKTGLIQPCERPIKYSLGHVDPQFGLSEARYLELLSHAELVWENALHRELFQYVPDGDLAVNFVYDYRQQATDRLQDIGAELKDDRASYDAVKTRYNSLRALYTREKAALEEAVLAYEVRKAAYEKQVQYWNKRKGASSDEYQKLEAERLALNAQGAELSRKQASLNTLVDSLNAAAEKLNRLARELNIQVDTYNTIGASTGKTFDEGEYTSDAQGTRITIYQFENQYKLERVLVHELGHALGLDHVDNPKAVMYYLNQGLTDTLAPEDITELKRACNI